MARLHFESELQIKRKRDKSSTHDLVTFEFDSVSSAQGNQNSAQLLIEK